MSMVHVFRTEYQLGILSLDIKLEFGIVDREEREGTSEYLEIEVSKDDN